MRHIGRPRERELPRGRFASAVGPKSERLPALGVGREGELDVDEELSLLPDVAEALRRGLRALGLDVGHAVLDADVGGLGGRAGEVDDDEVGVVAL